MIGEVSLLAAAICFYLFFSRRASVQRVNGETVPELDGAARRQLRELLATAYQRLCLLATGFLLLAAAWLLGRPAPSRMGFLVLVVVLALANTPPRTRAMRLLAGAGLSADQLRRRGIVL